MRRTTQWAVFRSMNQQPPTGRLMFDPAARTDADGAADKADDTAAQTQPQSRSTPDTRRDRVDFM